MFVVNALISLALIVLLGVAVLSGLVGGVLFAFARKGDRPVGFAPRQAALLLIVASALMVWQAFAFLVAMPPL